MSENDSRNFFTVNYSEKKISVFWKIFLLLMYYKKPHKINIFPTLHILVSKIQKFSNIIFELKKFFLFYRFIASF